MFKGAAVGFVSTFFTLPFQVISTNMKVSGQRQSKCSMIEMIHRIYNKEGMLGFYRGLIPNLLRIPIGNAFFFSTLEITQKYLHEPLHLNHTSCYLISSALGMTIECLAVNPILLISTRNETLGFNQYHSFIDALKQIRQKEGIKGFLSGLYPLIMKEVPSRSMFYLLYQFSYKQSLKLLYFKNTNINAFFSALFAGMVMSVIDNPLDLVRTRAQCKNIIVDGTIDDLSNRKQYFSLTNGLIDIYKHEGIKGFEKGVLPRLCRKIMSSTVTWTLYHALSSKTKRKK